MTKKPTAGEPKARRARGTGTIFFHESRGVWVGRVVVGRRANGTTRYAERSAPTQGELVALLRTAGPPGEGTTVGEWATRWLAEAGVRPGTLDTYRRTVEKFVVPQLGGVRVRDLTPHHVEAAARVWGAGRTPGTVRQHLRNLSVCLNAAVRAGLIATSPVRAARKPKAVRKQVDPFWVEHLSRIVEEAGKRPATRIIALLASVGCRSGEAIALDVSDWDGAARTVSITKTWLPKKRGHGPPKSANGTRTVRVPDAAVPAVLAALGKRRHGPLFPTSRGTRPCLSSVNRPWLRLLARLELQPRNLHQLRHSVATALISAGAPIGDVAAYLGDRPETVVKNYLHASGADPAATIDRLFKGS